MRRRAVVARLIGLLGGAVVIGSCQIGGALEPPQGGLQRMVEQPRYEPFEHSPFFDDGLTMRQPPEGAVRYLARPPSPSLETGRVDGTYLASVPLELSHALLTRGRERYDIVCAVCHGVLGTSDTPVAHNMELRPPPSLVAAPVVDYPAGRIYAAIAQGYGFMPAYAEMLSLEERWAVVAYVRALQRSQNATLDDVPEPARARLVGAVPTRSAP